MKKVLVVLTTALMFMSATLLVSTPEADAGTIRCDHGYSFATKCTEQVREKSPTYNWTQCKSVRAAEAYAKGGRYTVSAMKWILKGLGHSVTWLNGLPLYNVLAGASYDYQEYKYCTYWRYRTASCWTARFGWCNPD